MAFHGRIKHWENQRLFIRRIGRFSLRDNGLFITCYGELFQNLETRTNVLKNSVLQALSVQSAA
jgi:hypothetical protein